jgi:hypothetical protein
LLSGNNPWKQKPCIQSTSSSFPSCLLFLPTAQHSSLRFWFPQRWRLQLLRPHVHKGRWKLLSQVDPRPHGPLYTPLPLQLHSSSLEDRNGPLMPLDKEPAPRPTLADEGPASCRQLGSRPQDAAPGLLLLRVVPPGPTPVPGPFLSKTAFPFRFCLTPGGPSILHIQGSEKRKNPEDQHPGRARKTPRQQLFEAGLCKEL